MKRYFIWFILYSKRLLKKPSFLILLLLLPLCTFALTKLTKKTDSTIQAGVYLNLTKADHLAKSTYEILLEDKDIVKFYGYQDKNRLLHDIKTKKIDCGYVLPDNLLEALDKNGSNDRIQVFYPPDSMSVKMLNEKVYGAIIQEYSFDILQKFVSKEDIFSYMDSQHIQKELKSKYDHYRSNDSTFTFEYGYSKNGNTDGDSSIAEHPLDYLMLPIRGMLAVLILSAGFSGGLLWYTDYKNGIYQQVSGKLSGYVQFITIWIPVFYTGIASLLCIFLSGFHTSFFTEFFGMLFYCLLVTGFCSLLRLVLSTEIVYACALPITALISLAACPVFTDFSIYIPSLKLLRLLLPPYYFLNFQGSLYQLAQMGIIGILLIILMIVIHQIHQRRINL